MKQVWTTYIDPDKAREMLGFIPDFLDPEDERPAKEQLDANYRHGGGWNPMSGFTFDLADGTINYAGDPPYKPVASTYLPKTGETVVVYQFAWVGIFKNAKLIEVARMD